VKGIQGAQKQKAVGTAALGWISVGGKYAMAARKKRPKPGDLLKVAVDGGSAHLHYLGKHPEYGDAVRVVASECMPEASSDRDTLLAEGYVAFYPVVAAVSQGLVDVVGHHGTVTQVPSKLRRPGARSNDGRVLAWVIEEGGAEAVTKTLTPEQRALPIAVIWNHEMLCTRIREGWRPEREGA